MGDAKNTFIMYGNWEGKFERLSEKQRSIAIMSLFAVSRGGEQIRTDDAMFDMLVETWCDTVKSNNENYRKAVENGKKGGRPRKTKNPENPPLTPLKPNENVNANDNENENLHSHLENDSTAVVSPPLGGGEPPAEVEKDANGFFVGVPLD